MPAIEADRVSRCFKKYDVRGKVGPDLDDGVVAQTAHALAVATSAGTVVLGRDNRTSSAHFAAIAAKALLAAGCDVLDLGLCGTEEIYFAVSHFAAGAGICITASHNPIEYNGLKLVGSGSAPLPEAVFAQVRDLAARATPQAGVMPGHWHDVSLASRCAYAERVISFIDMAELAPLKILVNAGHGAAGPAFDTIAAMLADAGAPLTFVRMNHEPDSSFPAGIPNPLLPENRPVTSEAVRTAGAHFGVAWDGDFDRCFFFDEAGTFADGAHVVGLFAEHFLGREPGATVVHDPRVVWNTQEIVARLGGRSMQACTGHAFMKRAMRETGAVYGGEISAHHYFRDFYACDSGMIPWLLMASIVSRRGPLSSLLRERRAAFPTSGEINFTVHDRARALQNVRSEFAGAAQFDEMDGLSADFGTWRFNLRASQTEPLMRLNVEAKGDAALVACGVEKISRLLA